MKNLLKVWLICSLTLFFISSCDKDEIKKRPKANYGFSFYLNDEFWTPQSDKQSNWPFPDAPLFKSKYCPNGCGVGGKVYGAFSIVGTRILTKEDKYEWIQLNSTILNDGVTYSTSLRTKWNFRDRKKNCELENQNYYYDIDTTWSNHSFKILNIDYKEHRIQGKFNLRLISNENCSELRDTLYLTKGVLDVEIQRWY